MSTLLRERSALRGAKCVSGVRQKKNHFAKGCKDAAVNDIESDEDLEEISFVRVQAMKDKAVFAEMLVQQKPVRFQID